MTGAAGSRTPSQSFRKETDESIRLSICIPTFNRAEFIGETLSSIAKQLQPGVEVVIVDGASTDATPEIVSGFRSELPNLVYHRGQTNMGVDRDMATTVELARGKYCWLMSSDDLAAEDAISRIMEAIATEEDIYLCDATLCDREMRPIRDTLFLSRRRTSNTFDLGDKVDLLRYLDLATSNNALFCYMSTLVFRRERWVAVEFDPLFDRSGYAHVFRLLSFAQRGCRIHYLNHPVVLNRPGNDSFSTQGIEKRYLMDFDGYLALGDRLFSHDAAVRRAFLKVMTREHPWYRILKLRSEVRSVERWNMITAKLLEFGYSERVIAWCGVIGRAHRLVRAAIYVNAMFPRSSFLRLLRVGTVKGER